MFYAKLHSKIFACRLAARSLLVVLLVAAPLFAQQQQQPPPQQPDEQTVNVTTEEVFVPVLARDDTNRFDPSLELNEILVIEDGVPQQVVSVRRRPASVLVVLDTTGNDNRAMRTTTTRLVALSLLARLRPGDRAALLEQGTHVRRLHDWTDERDTLTLALRRQLSSGNSTRAARFTDALAEAAAMFDSEPRGNRHVVFITDGVEAFDGKQENLNVNRFAAASARLAASGALVHVISYARVKPELSTPTRDENQNTIAPSFGTNGLPNTVTATGDPTRAPGIPRGDALGSLGGGGTNFGLDFAMRRRWRAYQRALKASEERLASLATVAGGKLWSPTSADEMIEQSRQIAGEIAAQYTVTYKPRRPFAQGERRRIEVASRRVGVRLETRRSHVTSVSPGETP